MDVTVAICMYNAERYIEETLDCLMRQTRQDFTLLIVNDCSTDNGVAIVEQFFQKNPRQYEIVNFPVNQGLAAGRRYVEENATTKYTLFVDADDCPYPELVQKLYDKITSDSDLIAVGCHVRFIDSESRRKSGGIYLGESTKEAFIDKAAREKLIFMQPTAIYNREVALSVGGHLLEGFPEGKPRYRDLCEDLDLWTRMSDLYAKGKAIVVVPEVLCGYRKHENAMSTASMGMILRMRHIKSNLKLRRRGEPELTFVDFLGSMTQEQRDNIEREALSADSFRKGCYALSRGKLISAAKYLWASMMANPKYIVDKIKHNILRMK